MRRQVSRNARGKCGKWVSRPWSVSYARRIFLGNLIPILIDSPFCISNAQPRSAARNAVRIHHHARETRSQARPRGKDGGSACLGEGAGDAQGKAPPPPKCEMPERDHCKILARSARESCTLDVCTWWPKWIECRKWMRAFCLKDC